MGPEDAGECNKEKCTLDIIDLIKFHCIISLCMQRTLQTLVCVHLQPPLCMTATLRVVSASGSKHTMTSLTGLELRDLLDHSPLGPLMTTHWALVSFLHLERVFFVCLINMYLCIYTHNCKHSQISAVGLQIYKGFFLTFKKKKKVNRNRSRASSVKYTI